MSRAIPSPLAVFMHSLLLSALKYKSVNQLEGVIAWPGQLSLDKTVKPIKQMLQRFSSA